MASHNTQNSYIKDQNRLKYSALTSNGTVSLNFSQSPNTNF